MTFGEAEYIKLAVRMDKNQIILEIKRAFEGVKLGNGIGLNQGQALDDYEPDDVAMIAREKDEKEDWQSIPVEELDVKSSSLSFFDAEGMRFHLPAYLVADLTIEFQIADPLFHLYYGFTDDTRSEKMEWYEYSSQKFSLLTNDQRKAVIMYLEYRANDDAYEFERSSIIEALENYWNRVLDENVFA